MIPRAFLHAATAVVAVARLCCPTMAATYHVAQGAPGASDTHPGTAETPLRSVTQAMHLAQPGDTILVGEGTYREEVVWPGEDWKDPEKRITLAAAPGMRPVIKGSEPVAGPWEKSPVELNVPSIEPPAIYSCPWETYSQMVFVDGARLDQIGLQASPARARGSNGFQYVKQWDGRSVRDMRAGSFHYDDEGKRLYVWLADGSDPGARLVEASVRSDGLRLRGTWTVRGLDVCHFQDHFWPHEQAVVVSGDRGIVEDCRVTQNDCLGLIVSGQDGIVRNNEIAHNGLMGFTSNVGYRMLVEGNEIHHNSWRGDVKCLTAGNKFVMWRDSAFLRNRFHDEPGCALWLDISNANILIAENTFDTCNCGIYYEISRWAVIANNVFRDCGRAVWVYSSDVLVAHNALDSCGEGITVSGYPRSATYQQASGEPRSRNCLHATRNVQVINNLLVDCTGAFIGITENTPHGWGNWSDYNAFAWTLRPWHRTGIHLNFMAGWDSLYGKLPIWRLQRHQDLHSVVVDPRLRQEVRAGNPWVQLGEHELHADAKIIDREGGDWRLAPDSPLIGKGVAIPPVLGSVVKPCRGSTVLSRAFARTSMADAPDPAMARRVYGDAEAGHYRLQPFPALRPLVDLDSCGPGTPGLNADWIASGRYPQFRSEGEEQQVAADDWSLAPHNLVTDPAFDRPLAQADADGAWRGTGSAQVHQGMLAANLAVADTRNVLAYQRVGRIRLGAEYLLCADIAVRALGERFETVAGMYLATGDPGAPLGETLEIRRGNRAGGHWHTCQLHVRAPSAPDAPEVGKDLYVVLYGRVEGPAEVPAAEPVGYARWDNVWLLGSPEGQ